MNEDELRNQITTSAVIRGRFGSPGAFVRGWRIELANVLGDPNTAQAAGRLVRNLTAHIAADSIVGIERGGAELSRSIVAEAAKDGVDLCQGTWSAERKRPWSGPTQLGKRSIVVDDIVNSGRTARQAIRALESVGAEVLAVACLIQYPVSRPILLRGWNGPLLSVFGLRDLQLHRVIWPTVRS